MFVISDDGSLGEMWWFGCKIARYDEGYIGLVVSLVVGLVDLMKGPWGRCGGLVVSLLDLIQGT